MRRVVVTGLGMVTPLGSGVEHVWSRLIAGDSGAAKVTSFETDDLACKIACQIPLGDGSDGTFNPDAYMEVKEQRKVDPFIVYAIAAAHQALDDADWHPTSHEDQCATGVLVGSGIGGSLDRADEAYARQAAAHAYSAPVGMPVQWSNPQTGNMGAIRTTRDGWSTAGAYCREFQQQVVVGGRSERAYGTACQQRDGSWKIVG